MEDFSKEFSQTHENIKKIAQSIEEYKNEQYKPIYQKLLNFYWNVMIFYEVIEEEASKNEDTKMLSGLIEKYGDIFAKTYEKYAKYYNPDQLSPIISYLDNKISLFKEIYDETYLPILKNYKDILNLIENKDEKMLSFKSILLSAINAELLEKDKNEKIEKINKQRQEFINQFQNIDKTKLKQSIEINHAQNALINEIEKDISERLKLGKIELMDEKSIKLLNEINELQKELTNKLNLTFESFKDLLSKKIELNDAKSIKELYSTLINSLEHLDKNYHEPIVKNYKKNLESINKFIDAFDLMFGLKEKLKIQKIEENKEITKERFDFKKNALDKIMDSEKLRVAELKRILSTDYAKKDINEANQKMQKLLERLKGGLKA